MSKAIAPRSVGRPAGAKDQASGSSTGRKGYAALCELVDVWLGKIMAELEAEPVTDLELGPSGALQGDAPAAGSFDAASDASFLDSFLGGSTPFRKRRVLSQAGPLNSLDATLVCFTSDHGDLLGDGGRWGKQVAGQGAVAVPLVCRGPRALFSPPAPPAPSLPPPSGLPGGGRSSDGRSSDGLGRVRAGELKGVRPLTHLPLT
mmetsp:Transcript_14704/g.34666  ORF Transcript_14704/g.34666 Transcript_14704/m.34666 type:complete len:204 (-) Transcript_14704:935-1546(-)